MHQLVHRRHFGRPLLAAAAGYALMALHGVAAQPQPATQMPGFIVDAENGCATSNPIPRLGETIRWSGDCANGLLHGQGTLLWLRDGKPRERNEGSFLAGELDGQASTTFADGTLLVGQYRRGIRHGEFILRRPNGATIRAVYADGALISERQMEAPELRQMRERPPQPIPVQPQMQAQLPQQYQQQVYQTPPAYQPQAAYTPPAYVLPVYVPTTVAPAMAPASTGYVSPWSPSAYRGAAAPAYQAPAYQQVPAYQPPAYQPPAYQAPVYQAAPYPQPVSASVMYEASGRVGALGGPELALGDAMMLERAGRNAEAAQLYGQIAAVAGNTATGLLANERAWGIDIGYERQLGRRGIIGANFFYRDITNLIELFNTGEDAEAGGNVYEARNAGKGQSWGMEIDFSTPLDFAGLPDTGLFANYTWLDSEMRDPTLGTKRRFNNQPRHIYNLGFIQTIQSLDASLGASLSGRSKAKEVSLDEEVDLSYGKDLEAFVEKRFADRFVLRLSASNLLNRKKKEGFVTFDGDSVADIIDAHRAGEVEESERESEQSGRLFQVTLRATF